VKGPWVGGQVTVWPWEARARQRTHRLHCDLQNRHHVGVNHGLVIVGSTHLVSSTLPLLRGELARTETGALAEMCIMGSSWDCVAAYTQCMQCSASKLTNFALVG